MEKHLSDIYQLRKLLMTFIPVFCSSYKLFLLIKLNNFNNFMMSKKNLTTLSIKYILVKLKL